MDVVGAVATTRATRRLDPDRPVSDADVLAIVAAATKGPSGGNRRPVRSSTADPRARSVNREALLG